MAIAQTRKGVEVIMLEVMTEIVVETQYETVRLIMVSILSYEGVDIIVVLHALHIG